MEQQPQLMMRLDRLEDLPPLSLSRGDTLHIHSIDRLARSLRDLLNIVEELLKRGVKIVFHKEGMEFDGVNPRQCRQKNCFVNMEHTFHSNTASRLWFQRIKQDKRFKK